MANDFQAKDVEEMQRKQRYRAALVVMLAISVAGLLSFHYKEEKRKIPDAYLQTRGEDIPEYDSPWVTQKVVESAAEAAANPRSAGGYKISYQYLGLIPMKEAQVEILDPVYVIPGGAPIGIYAETKGILVIGTGKVEGADGLSYEPALRLVKEGDYIQAINGTPLSEKEDLIEAVQESAGEEVILEMRRENEKFQVRVEPVQEKDGAYKLGIWVRDNTQGIGTLTYLTEDGNFGALGHGVSDADTGLLLEVSSGKLYDTNIVDIKKGERGIPGELTGLIRYRMDLECGDLLKNTNVGIFGTARDRLYQKVLPERVQVGYKQEIKLGEAWVRSSLGGPIKDYRVEITEIHCKDTDINKGIVLQVTDPELLAQAGGIVQGMSGSPIFQNGKLIGAVTHVFVQDSAKGFGVFIENMLEQKLTSKTR